MISVLDLFKIGIGPSSSHTVGPMVSAQRFRDLLGIDVARVKVELFGSLAWTGRGHCTDVAICLGLLGETPAQVDPDAISGLISRFKAAKTFQCGNGRYVEFDLEQDLAMNLEVTLPHHSNALRYQALAANGAVLLEKVYYSVGGGFVVGEGEPLEVRNTKTELSFTTATELLGLCEEHGKSIADIQMANETSSRSPAEVEGALDTICAAMFDCIDRGLRTEGLLPGKFQVKRRAKALIERLQQGKRGNGRRPHEVMDWVSTFAIAVNEENAAGGRVVTAPTNGAAGIIPAVLRYFRDFCSEYTPEEGRIFLLSAGAMGSIIKSNASISGAEVGCQGEVGSAAAMAAAGLAAVLGATPKQVENAAEIAMEHHLGMTCDPIGGLVQIPCIERNAIGANKAIAAASLALCGDGTHRVSFDQVIETMRQTGADMQAKYKETSLGGLAVNVPEC